MPGWIWGILGVIVAAGILFGAFRMFRGDPLPAISRDEEQASLKRAMDDLPDRDQVDLEKATHPTDLPEKLQKKFDKSMLSDEHSKAIAAALGPLSTASPDGELIDTRGKPSASDDFSDSSSGWTVRTDSTAAREYKDGKLRITFLEERGSAQVMSGRQLGDFAMEIEAMSVSGPKNFSCGLVVRQPEPETFIVLLILPEQKQFTIVKREKGANVALVKPTSCPAIKGGTATNVLKVYSLGTNLAFAINGYLSEVLDVGDFPAGDAGVIVVRSENEERDPTRVSFDNFKLWTAPKEQAP